MNSLLPWRRSVKSHFPAVGKEADWFDRYLSNPFESLIPSWPSMFTQTMPAVDVNDNGKEISVRAELPGLDEKDVDVTYQQGILRICGEKKEEKEENKKGSHLRECRYGSFRRDIPIGQNIDWKNAKAKYKKGILTVTIPKKESAGREVKITIN